MAVPLGRAAPGAVNTSSGGLGGFVSDIMGSTNRYQATAHEVDPNAYQYGGRPGYAQETANRYRTQAEQAQGRQGVSVNYGQAAQDRGLGLQARQGQSSLAQAMAARASGQTPSIASMEAARNLQQANAAQSSAAASARGAAGIAMAQQNAANNTANQQAAISGQAQINAANERMQAEQAAMGAYSNIRGGDLASQQQSAQQAQYQAGLSDAQRARNDAMTMGMTQNEMGVNNTQLAAQMNQQAQQSSNQMGAQQINASIAGQNAAMNQQSGQQAMGMIQGLVGGLLADGGPMKSGPKPYLVGERGPELVLPKKDGYVIPAEITAKMLAGRRAEGGNVNAPTSTWGVGPGKTESMATEDLWKIKDQRANNEANYARLAADRDARLAESSGAGGGMAIAGGPGTGTTLDEPLKRADQETIGLSRAKEAEGVELTDEERRKLSGAEHRAGSTKKGEKMSLGDFISKSGKAMQQQQASAIDVGYHGPAGSYAPPQLIQISGPRAMGGPISSSGSPFGQLAAVHHMPTMDEVNRSSFARPGIAKAMMPGMALADGGHMYGCRAEGGPVDGSDEVVPLYSPPGKWLQSTPEGRAYYIDEPKPLEERIDPSRPSLSKILAPQPKESPIAARTPVSLPPSQTQPKRMSDDELLAWANSLEKDMRSQHDKRMAQGPSVSLASRMGRR